MKQPYKSTAAAKHGPRGGAVSAPEPVRGRGIQSIEIGGHLLRTLANAPQPMMLRDLAEAVRMPSGKAHTYLVSFRKLALVEQDGIGRYRLGPFALKLGLAYLHGWQPYKMADEAVAKFADGLDLTTAITIWGASGPTVIRIRDSSHQLHANVRAGTVFGLTSTATGRLFAAYQSHAVVEPMIRSELAEAIGTSKPQLATAVAEARTDMEAIRGNGFATTEGRPVPGINAVSAPVFGDDGQMHLAITLMGPADAIPCRPGSRPIASLLTFTRGLSHRLGFAASP